MDVTDHSVCIAQVLHGTSARYTLVHVAAALRGSRQERVRALNDTALFKRYEYQIIKIKNNSKIKSAQLSRAAELIIFISS